MGFGWCAFHVVRPRSKSDLGVNQCVQGYFIRATSLPRFWYYWAHWIVNSAFINVVPVMLILFLFAGFSNIFIPTYRPKRCEGAHVPMSHYRRFLSMPFCQLSSSYPVCANGGRHCQGQFNCSWLSAACHWIWNNIRISGMRVRTMAFTWESSSSSSYSIGWRCGLCWPLRRDSHESYRFEFIPWILCSYPSPLFSFTFKVTISIEHFCTLCNTPHRICGTDS